MIGKRLSYIGIRAILIFCASLLGSFVVLTPHGISFTPKVAKACGLGPTATMTANDTQALFYPQNAQVQNTPSGIFSSDYISNQGITFTEDLSRLPTPVNPDDYRWHWDFGDGQSASGFQVKHQYTKAGTYRIHVDLTDPRDQLNNEPNFDSADINILTQPYDKPPIAKAVGSAKFVQIGGTVTFNSAGSQAQVGSKVTYLWNFGDGTTDTSPTPTHTFALPGQGFVALIVQDERGARTTATVPVYVVIALPTAKVKTSVTSVFVGNSVDFDASGSSPISAALQIGDKLVSYQWDFGDGTTASTKLPTISHTYQQAGDFTVTVQAFDNLGIPGVTTTTIHVDATGGQAGSGGGFNFAVFFAVLAVVIGIIGGALWWRNEQQQIAFDRAAEQRHYSDKQRWK